MANLETSSRKIADHYLHAQIRQSEALPNVTQIDFSNAVDFLLAEIVRVLKWPNPRFDTGPQQRRFAPLFRAGNA